MADGGNFLFTDHINDGNIVSSLMMKRNDRKEEYHRFLCFSFGSMLPTQVGKQKIPTIYANDCSKNIHKYIIVI